MAKAYTNQVFQKDYQQWKAYAKDKQNLDPFSCLKCHAPLAIIANDIEVKKSLSKEGISCDVCHRVSKVKEKEGKHSLVFDPRGIKYGPNKNFKPTPFHESSYGEAIKTSELCAACHLDSDSPGMPLEHTYREWRESPYAQQGITCQACHMRSQVDDYSRASKTPHESKVSHRFEGGHATSTLLSKAVSLKILSGTNRAEIQVQVTNVSVGHNFPTKGAHPNELILKFSAKDNKGNEIHQENRIYALTNLNAQGKAASSSEKVVSLRDTTLKPKEIRTETFNNSASSKASRIDVELIYYFIPEWLGKQIDSKEYNTHYRPVVIDKVSVNRGL